MLDPTWKPKPSTTTPWFISVLAPVLGCAPYEFTFLLPWKILIHKDETHAINNKWLLQKAFYFSEVATYPYLFQPP